MPPQIFQNRFDRNLGTIKSMFVGHDDVVISLHGARQECSGLPQFAG